MSDTAVENYLQKEQTLLPKEPMDLPLPEKELSAGSNQENIAENISEENTPPQVESVYRKEDISSSSTQQQRRVPQQEDYSQYEQSYQQQRSVKTLLSWVGMGRPFHEHSREYYINVSLIVLIVEVILFLFSQYVLMLVIISLLFVVIALAVVPPHTVHYRISTEGIAIDDYFYLWQELYDFYFKHVNGEDILHIRTRDETAADISILIGEVPKEYIRSLLLNYLPYRESVPLTFMERSGDWLTKTFPLDKVPSRT